jgi:metal-dependent amidase/aminoacylase/carboxypeptidase family protein
MATPSSSLESRIQDLLPGLERVYTDIHAHPELSMQETRTARIAVDRLRDGSDAGRVERYVDAGLQPAEETGTGARAMVDGGLLIRFPKTRPEQTARRPGHRE